MKTYKKHFSFGALKRNILKSALFLSLLSLAPYEFVYCKTKEDIRENQVENAVLTIFSEYPRSDGSLTYIPDSIKKLVASLKNESHDVFNYSRDDLVRAIDRNRPNFIFANSDLAILLKKYRDYEPLLSFQSAAASDPRFSASSLIITLKTSSVKALSQLTNQRIGKLSTANMAGWKSAVGEVQSMGLDTKEFFKRLQTFQSRKDMLSALLNGKIEAAILPGCAYERLNREVREQLKPIEPRNFSGNQCLSTSELYPSWTLLVSRETPAGLKNLVQSILENYHVPGNVGVWSSPADLRDVYALIRRTNDHLIDYYEPKNIIDFLREFRFEFFFIIILIATLVIHDRIMTLKFNRQTLKLKKTLNEQHQAERKLNAWEKANIIGTMSTMVSHELKQPLTVINNFSQSLLARVERDEQPLKKDVILYALNNIQESTEKALAIIDHVRSYSRGTDAEKSKVNLSSLVSSLITKIQTKSPNISVSQSIQPNIFIFSNLLETEICILNILKNADEALVGTKFPQIQVELEKTKDNYALVKIWDNGPGLTESQIRNLSHPLQTSKEKGLGLGISLVRTILEKNRGSLQISSRKSGGLLIEMKFGSLLDNVENSKQI